MFRKALGWGFIAMAVSMAGCTMCQHPYDYHGPVYGSADGCQPSSWHSRAGSILSGTTEIVPSQYDEYNEPDFLAGETKNGDVPGSERIVSVTDQAVDPASPAGKSSQIADRSTPSSQYSPSAAGWTARKPSSTTRR